MSSPKLPFSVVFAVVVIPGTAETITYIIGSTNFSPSSVYKLFSIEIRDECFFILKRIWLDSGWNDYNNGFSSGSQQQKKFTQLS